MLPVEVAMAEKLRKDGPCCLEDIQQMPRAVKVLL